MMIAEFLFFALTIGGFNLLSHSATIAVFSGLGAGVGAVLGALRNQKKPWFKRPQTFVGWMLAIGLLLFWMILSQALVALASPLIGQEAEYFLVNVGSMYFVRRFFLAIQS